MKKYGLPTFPIADGMDVGERAQDELVWLLEHGYLISSPIGSYLKIRKSEEGYVLVSGSHERHLVSQGEETVVVSSELRQVLKSRRIKRLDRWQWYGNEE